MINGIGKGFRVNRVMAVLLLMVFAGTVFGAPAGNVAVIVNADLQPLIQQSLDQYVDDLQYDGYGVIVQSWDLTQPDQNSPAELKAYLEGLTDLSGVVLVGDVPVCIFYHAADSWDTTFACDLYYMDVGTFWSDNNGDGKYDTIAGGWPQPSVWVSRITAGNMPVFTGMTEADLVNRYFTKNHAFRTGDNRLPDKALMWSDTDWNWYGPSRMGGAYSDITTIRGTDGYTMDKADWVSRWQTPYETEFFMCHSSATSHNPGGRVYGSEIVSGDPMRLFWNCWNCSSGDYVTGNYVAGVRLFTPQYGLLAIASTKTGSMYTSVNSFYTELGNAENHGDAYLYWRTRIPQTSYYASWNRGLVILGDGTLQLGRHHSVKGNAAPVIDIAPWADPDAIILPNTETTLSVVAYDPDGDALTYTWSKASGPGTVSFSPNGTDLSDVTAATLPATAGSYAFRVDVRDSKGQVTTSDTVAVTISDPSVLDPPSGLSGSASGMDVTLTWTDNSGNEEGFSIERGIKSGNGKNATYTWAVVGTVGSDITTYVDTVPGNGEYYYRAQAFNDTTGMTSSYSNQIKVRVGKGGGKGGGKPKK